MSKLRWSKLWWGDWENDPALRLCSLAAQGLWMRMLCMAAAADPYGHVLVAGKPPSIAQLARIVGAQGSQVRHLVEELERNRVLSEPRTVPSCAGAWSETTPSTLVKVDPVRSVEILA